MHRATRPTLRRLAAIDKAVRAGEFPNATTLAEDLETSSRTIQRDIEFMRDSLRAPLAFCRKHNGYHYSDETWNLPHFQLTQGELVALFIAERVLRHFRGTPYEADLKAAFQKITASLPDQVTVNLDALDQTHSFKTSTITRNDVQTFQRLAKAVLEHRQMKFTYWTAWRDDVNQRIVDPYHLANIDGEWYVIGYCHLREDVRMFSPARIRKLEESGDTFEFPADFSIARYLDGAFRVVRDADSPKFQVRLRFASQVAGYVREKVWHPSQQLADTPDGQLEFTLQVNSLIEVRRWILSFGPDCEVLEPEELRKQLQDDAVGLAALYWTQKQPCKPLAASSRRRRSPRRNAEAG